MCKVRENIEIQSEYGAQGSRVHLNSDKMTVPDCKAFLGSDGVWRVIKQTHPEDIFGPCCDICPLFLWRFVLPLATLFYG